jgi:DNA invertase Pin-like site-specific DNA recombinase
MRYVGYYRVSTDKQAEKFTSIPAQMSSCREYVERMGGVVAGHYEDPGISGSTMDRPGLQSMLEDAKTGLFDRVIVYAIDRLSREEIDCLLIERDLDAAGVWLESVSEPSWKDRTEDSAILMRSFTRANAKIERAKVVRRVNNTLKNLAANGRMVGNAPVGYSIMVGERGKGLYIDEGWAKVVRWIFDEIESGKAVNELVREMNVARMPPPSQTIARFGAVADAWQSPTLFQIVRNRAYVGMIRYKGEWLQGAHDPIVDAEQFERVGEIVKKRGRAKAAGSRGLFAGGLLRCPHCWAAGVETPLTAMRSARGQAYACRLVVKAYHRRCAGTDPEDVGHTFIVRETKVRRALVAALSRILGRFDPQQIAAWSAAEPDAKPKREVVSVAFLERQLDAVKPTLLRLQDSMARGIISEEDYLAHKLNYDREAEGLRDLIERHRTPPEPPSPTLKGHDAAWLLNSVTGDGDPIATRDNLNRLVECLVPSIDRKRIEIHWQS